MIEATSIKTELHDKLVEFINKYYVNSLLNGLIHVLFLGLLVFLLLTTLEYFIRFNSVVRAVFFYGFISLLFWLIITKIASPLLSLLGVRNRMSYESAASLVGSHFNEVEDKLLNTIQLSSIGDKNDLLLASVNQRMAELKPFNFKLALSSKEIFRQFKRLLPVLAIILGIGVFVPSLLTEGTERIVSYSDVFAPPAPFRFSVKENELTVPQNEDFTVNLSLIGDEIPNEVYVKLNGFLFKMKKESLTDFSYTFKSVQKSQLFLFSSGEFSSESYLLKTFPSPEVNGFSIEVNYPSYTRRSSDTYENTGDFILPEGSSVSWSFEGKDCDHIKFVVDSTGINLEKEGSRFVHQETINNTFYYSINTSNQYLSRNNYLSYQIQVVKDEKPSISVMEDELEKGYFSGNISDDYGFSSCSMIVEKNGEIWRKEALNINKKNLSQSFFHYVNTDSLSLEEGEEVVYYFEVYDNDGVNGAKRASSQKFIYKAPSLSEISENVDAKSDQVKSEVSDAMKDLKEIQKNLDDFKKDLTQKKQLDWQDKKKLSEILKKQEKLEEQIKDMSSLNKEKNELSKKLSQKEEEILKKQEQLEKLFDKVFDEEMKKLMEEIERMMEELDKEKTEDLLEKMEISNEDLEKELDRSLEMFKQLEYDLKQEEITNQLEKLAQKQKDLAEETKDPKSNPDNKDKSKEEINEDLKKKQEEISKEFEEVEKELEELKKKNEELEEKKPFEEFQEQREEVKSEQKKSEESIEQNKQNKASEQQEKAGEKMQEMAEKMKSMQEEMQEEQQQENMEDMRTLLDNLIELSLQQESLQAMLLSTHYNDPKYPKIKLAQSNIRDESKLVEDSLFALSKRVVQLESTINKEMAEINRNMDKVLHDLAERKKGDASNRQQLVMTSLNNLALIMDDVLQQMQQEMKQKKMGKSSCSKPGQNSKPSMSKSQMQKQLNQQMKDLQEQMGKQGKGSQGEGKEGGKKGEMSKKIAKLAAEQGAIREELKRLQQELEKEKSGGEGAGDLQKLMDEIEKSEKDLYNKNITPELIRRQQEILTRLLEHENAQKEREWDDKRESKEGENEKNGNPSELLEYKRLKEREAELLQTVPVDMKPYYKRKANEYLNSLEQDDRNEK